MHQRIGISTNHNHLTREPLGSVPAHLVAIGSGSRLQKMREERTMPTITTVNTNRRGSEVTAPTPLRVLVAAYEPAYNSGGGEDGG